jgi:hypothetical protein
VAVYPVAPARLCTLLYSRWLCTLLLQRGCVPCCILGGCVPCCSSEAGGSNILQLVIPLQPVQKDLKSSITNVVDGCLQPLQILLTFSLTTGVFSGHSLLIWYFLNATKVLWFTPDFFISITFNNSIKAHIPNKKLVFQLKLASFLYPIRV